MVIIEYVMDKKLEKLRQELKNERENRVRKRMMVVLKMKTENQTPHGLAKKMNCTVQSVYNWISKFDTEGVDGLRDRPKAGRHTKVSRKKLDKIFLGNQATTKEIQSRIYKETGVKYTLANIQRLVREYRD